MSTNPGDRLAKHAEFLRDQAEKELGPGRRDIASPSDFVQDALVAALEQQRKGEGPAAIPAVEAAYLWKALQNKIRAAFRKADAEIHGGKVKFTSIDGDNLPGSATSPSEKFRKKTREESLEKALRALEPRDQRVLTLKFAEDKSSTEIAEILGITPKYARDLSKRALERLRDAYVAEGGPWDFS